MAKTKQNKLEDECIRALSGAEYVRDKLLSLLTIGPRNLSLSSYAIKCRVKTQESLAGKVLKKRESGKPYHADNATDIVGLRILTILSQDLEAVTREFLDFISFCQSPQVGLCQGNTLDDAIEEIIVYKSKTNTHDYDLVYSMLARRQWGNLPTGKPKLEKRQASIDQPYSSIHIVTRCVSLYGKTPKLIPVETQIRTIFEDVWNELDHPLRYKGIRNKRPRFNLRLQKDIDRIDKQLHELKDKLEICGSDAENIYEQHQRLVETIDQKRRQRAEIDRLTSFEIDKHFAIDANSCLVKPKVGLGKKFREIEAGINDLVKSDVKSAAKSIKQSRQRVKDYISAVELYEKEVTSLQPGVLDWDVLYFSGLLKGLLYMWLAKIERYVSGSEVLSFRDPWRNAMDLYTSLEERFRDDAFLQFRLASGFLLGGMEDDAFDRIREAAGLSERCKRIKDRSVIKSMIERRLGFLAWRQRQLIQAKGQAIGAPQYRKDAQVNLLELAVISTQKSADFLKVAEVSAADRSAQDRILNNNLVSYCWDIMDTADENLEEGLILVERVCRGHIDFAAIAKAILGKRGAESLDPGSLDSVLKAFELARDDKEVAHYTELLAVALRSPDIHKQSPARYQALMRYTLTRVKMRNSGAIS